MLIVSDGALEYIPFAVLPAPESAAGLSPAIPLVIDHEIVNLPSASVLAVLRREAMSRKPAPKAVAVVADPVFDIEDARVKMASKTPGRIESRTRGIAEAETDGSPRSFVADRLLRSAADVGMEMDGRLELPRLPFTRREAETILAVTPAGSTKSAFDFDASRATATSPELAQYRIIHFATHSILDSKHPELSGLVLSMVDRQGKAANGFLDLEDIYNLNLSADLVVLSACETGLGKEINGEGLVGLTRGFMYAGASRVVASLWKVDDVATAQLMGRFYKAMEQDGMRPAAALRQAQIQMWKQKRWSAPYYWAAFQVQGEWR